MERYSASLFEVMESQALKSAAARALATRLLTRRLGDAMTTFHFLNFFFNGMQTENPSM